MKKTTFSASVLALLAAHLVKMVQCQKIVQNYLLPMKNTN